MLFTWTETSSFSSIVVIGVSLSFALLFQNIHLNMVRRSYRFLWNRSPSEELVKDHFMLSHRRALSIACMLSFLLITGAFILGNDEELSPSSVAFVFCEKNESLREKQKQAMLLKDRENIITTLSQSFLPAPSSLWILQQSTSSRKSLTLLVPPTVDSFFLALVAGENLEEAQSSVALPVSDKKSAITPRVSQKAFSDALYIVISHDEAIPSKLDRELFPPAVVWCHLPLNSGRVENARIIYSTHSFLEGASLKEALTSLHLLIKKDERRENLTSSSGIIWISTVLVGFIALLAATLWVTHVGLISSLKSLFVLFLFIVSFNPSNLLGKEYEEEANRLVYEANLLLSEDDMFEDGIKRLLQALQIISSQEARQRIYLSLSKALLSDHGKIDQSIAYMKEALQCEEAPSSETLSFLVHQLNDIFVSSKISFHERRALASLCIQYISRLPTALKESSVVFMLHHIVQEQEALLKWSQNFEWPYLHLYQSAFLSEGLNEEARMKNELSNSLYLHEGWKLQIPVLTHEFRERGLDELVDYVLKLSELFSTKSTLKAKEECYMAFLLTAIYSRISSLQLPNEETSFSPVTYREIDRDKVIEIIFKEALRISRMSEIRQHVGFGGSRESLRPEMAILKSIFEKVGSSFNAQLASECEKRFFEMIFTDPFRDYSSESFSFLIFAWQFFSQAIALPRDQNALLPEERYSSYEDLLMLCLKEISNTSSEHQSQFLEAAFGYLNFEESPTSLSSLSVQLFNLWFQKAPLHALSWLKAFQEIAGQLPIQKQLELFAQNKLSLFNASEYKSEDLLRMLSSLKMVEAERSMPKKSSLYNAIDLVRGLKAGAFSENMHISRNKASPQAFQYSKKVVALCSSTLKLLGQEIDALLREGSLKNENEFSPLLQRVNEIIKSLSGAQRTQSSIRQIVKEYHELYTVAGLIEEKLLYIGSSTNSSQSNREMQASQSALPFMFEKAATMKEDKMYSLSIQDAASLYRKMDAEDRIEIFR